MRANSLARSAVTIAGLALVCLTAGSLLPGSGPAAAVPDHTVGVADIPAISYAPEGPSAPSVSASPPAASGSERTSADAPSSGSESPAKSPASKSSASKSSASKSAASKSAASKTTPKSTTKASPAPSPAGPAAGIVQIAPSPALHVSVPSIGVDADVVPVDSAPTGRTNEFGGPIYSQIDFPVDLDVRQWVRRGDPNSIAPAAAAADVKSFDRVVLYGHASSIGNHLVFQDLSQLTPGQKIVVTTAKGVFTYQVTLTASRAKVSLDNMPELYAYPTNGRKEIALVACLPDSTSNTVVIGQLVGATKR
ncbi:class F sortase [Nakamurella lactea]|uniref:class F sortase n=1 Tax=Nakamurella lactea TaxID=459515 RepID=UPI0013768705|nr:class F sortase [Nakamurella lactea]